MTPERRLLNAVFGITCDDDLSPNAIDVIHRVLVQLEQDKGKVLPRSPGSSPRMVMAIKLRYGFIPRAESDGKDNVRTMKEVGTYLGVTPERIRQIEAKALRILRHPFYSNQLRSLK